MLRKLASHENLHVGGGIYSNQGNKLAHFELLLIMGKKLN